MYLAFGESIVYSSNCFWHLSWSAFENWVSRGNGILRSAHSAEHDALSLHREISGKPLNIQMRYLRNFNRAVPQTRSSVQTILQGFSAPPRPHLWVLFLYIFLTGWMLYPLSFQFADHVPDPGDPLEYAWVIAWDSRQLVL